MHYGHPECPAYGVALEIQKAEREALTVTPRRQVRIPPVAWLGWVVAAVLLANLLACGGRSRDASASPPVESPGPAAALVADVEALEVRVKRFAARSQLRRDASEYAPTACITGVDRVTYSAGEVTAKCRARPNVGVRRVE